MLSRTAAFARVANVVCAQLREVITMPIYVLDDARVVVSSTDSGAVGLAFAMRDPYPGEDVRAALVVESYTGEVVVTRPAVAETSPTLIARLIDLTISLAVLGDDHSGPGESRNKFIRDLLHGLLPDAESIRRQSMFLGLRLARPRAVILIDATDFILAPLEHSYLEPSEVRVQRRIEVTMTSIISYFQRPYEAITAYVGDGELVVLMALDAAEVAAAGATGGGWADLPAVRQTAEALLARLHADQHTEITIGVGRHQPGYTGLATSYHEARTACSLGGRLRGPGRVYTLHSLGLAAFVGIADEPLKVDLARHLLAPITQDPALLATLEGFFAHGGSPSAAAAALSIHRNTLTYRLGKITALTGLDPRRFEEAVQLRCAVLLHKL